MNAYLNDPFIQSGILPFAIVLAVTLIFQRLGRLWAALGFALAFLATIYLLDGFQFTPLTSTRKVILLCLCAVPLGLVIDYLSLNRRAVSAVLTIAASAAVWWVIWRILQRQEGMQFWLMGGLSAAYVACLVVGFERLRSHSHQAICATFALGLGTSLSALVGASALLAQLAAPVAAAAGAYLLVSLFRSLSLGSVFLLPVAVLCAAIGVNAVVTANVVWYSLIPLLFIPFCVRVPTPGGPFLKTVFGCLLTLPFAAVSVGVNFYIHGAPPI